MNYKRIPLGPLWTNCYVVDDGCGTALCADVGGEPEDILAWLKRENLHLDAIVLTHGHMDHILGVCALQKATGARLYVPEDDAAMLTNPDLSLASEFGVDVEPAKADVLTREGYQFTVGALTLTTLHTPGHTKGSTCYIVEQGTEKLLLAGDTLFARSIGRTDLAGGDEEAMNRSLSRLAAIEGDMPVLPGHGPVTTLETERQKNPFLKG
ncbi:MAG: MBL fold metallo-hydrolase [Pyramidobacter sp.]|nr:MBL fold metallo-hydrolase [Pyramidobacter sp.]